MAEHAAWYPKELQSRAHPSRRYRITHPTLGVLDIVYCMSCCKPHGGVNPNCPSILILCPRCAARYGGLPLPKLTDEDLEIIELSRLQEG